jgi:hypothetical protein
MIEMRTGEREQPLHIRRFTVRPSGAIRPLTLCPIAMRTAHAASFARKRLGR